MRIDVLTLFPEMFSGPLDHSIVGRARERGLLDVRLTDIRDFTTDKHRQVDDAPYGGGPGMVMKPEPIFAAVEAVAGEAGGSRARRSTGARHPAGPARAPVHPVSSVGAGRQGALGLDMRPL